MLFLNKKRIFLISSFIIISFSVYVFQISYLNKLKTLETVSLPVSNKVIVLDAGHGGEDRTVRFLQKELQKLI